MAQNEETSDLVKAQVVKCKLLGEHCLVGPLESVTRTPAARTLTLVKKMVAGI